MVYETEFGEMGLYSALSLMQRMNEVVTAKALIALLMFKDHYPAEKPWWLERLLNDAEERDVKVEGTFITGGGEAPSDEELGESAEQIVRLAYQVVTMDGLMQFIAILSEAMEKSEA